MEYLIGFAIAILFVWMVMPSLMILKRRSRYSFDDTISRICDNVKAEKWSLMGLRPLHEAVAKHGLKASVKVTLIEVCHPQYANEIISHPTATALSVMMPCVISVYEDEKKQVWIANMNTRPMGWLFGGVVRRVMSGPVSKAQKKFLNL